MESTNFHHQQYHHQLQDQIAGSSPLPTPSSYGVLGSSTHAWIPNTILKLRNFSSNSSGFIINNSRQQYEYFLIPSLNSSSMTQDLGFQWASNSQCAHDLHLSRIKGELSDSYKKLTDEIIHSSPSMVEDLHLQPTSHIKNVEQRDLNDQSHGKLFLRNFSSGCQINGLQIQAGGFSSLASVHTPCRGSFSRIYPTINISNPNHSSSFDTDLQALDLFTSGRFSGSLRSQDSHDNLCLYKDTLSYGIDLTQQSFPRPSNSSTKKISAFTNEITEAKRHSSFLDPKVPQSAQKKSRFDSRPSSASFKVRKEKLSDRIAALQQLVAPFGKTDTASVLMEAIGYIKFLQNQVETLSVPYMNSSRSNNCRTMKGVSAEDGNGEARGDLGSRGLCLVPLSCLSYVTDGGGGVWLPANFNT